MYIGSPCCWCTGGGGGCWYCIAVAAAAAPFGVAVAVAPAQPQVESEFRASRLRSPFLLAPRRANPELLFCLYKPPPSFC